MCGGVFVLRVSYELSTLNMNSLGAIPHTRVGGTGKGGKGFFYLYIYCCLD